MEKTIEGVNALRVVNRCVVAAFKSTDGTDVHR